jgi:hypothetical protein
MQTVKYTVENQFGETLEYSFRSPLKSRAHAVNQLKLFRGEAKTYNELKLSYSIDSIQTIDLITGKRQSSEDILDALANEFEILANLDLPYDLPPMITEGLGTRYLTLADDFVFLYYFTAE